MLPVFPPFTLLFTAKWDGVDAFNAHANVNGIKYKFHFLYITCSLQLSCSDSEIVLTPSDVGSMLAPCLYGRGFGSERPFFYKMTHFRKRLIAILTSELQRIT